MCGNITSIIWSHLYWWSCTLPDIDTRNMPMCTMHIVSDRSVKASAEGFLIEKHNYSNFQAGQKHVCTHYNGDMESTLLVVFHSAGYRQAKHAKDYHANRQRHISQIVGGGIFN